MFTLPVTEFNDVNQGPVIKYRGELEKTGVVIEF
jgi:hypothetical protein